MKLIKNLISVFLILTPGYLLAVPAVFFNGDLTAGRDSFTNTVNSTVSGSTPPPSIFIVDIGAQAGQSQFQATSGGNTIYVSTFRAGSPATNNTSYGSGQGYTAWSVSYTPGNFTQVIDNGYTVSFFSNAARTTPINVNAIGIQTMDWGTCCTGNNTVPDGSEQPGSAIYMNFSGATSGELLVGNITSSISGTQHFVGAINDTAFFNTITLAPNGIGEFFGVGSYLMFATVALNSVPAGSSVVTVGTTSITDIVPNNSFTLSTVVTGYNPIFAGGILSLVSGDSSNQAFTVRSSGGTIDVASGSATLTGIISDEAGNSNGGLTKTGTGTLTLTGTNSYTGGTTVSAGTLIGNTSSLQGNVVNNAAVGFNQTTAGTYAGNMSGTGDLTKTGTGTLTLTGTNSYTGGTTVSAGTLALSGAGVISNSSSVSISSGTLDITGASGNVSLAGSYSQAPSGNLSMGFAPADNQRLIIAGAATVDGGLNLVGSAGSYRPGRFALVTASSLTGRFASLTTDLPAFTRLGYALTYDAFGAYLLLTPNLDDTQQSLANSASVLQGTFALQNSVLANSFTYDCSLFGKNGVCVSAGGRNTAVQAANGLNNTSGLIIASYRLDKNNSRIGAYADQNLSITGPGTVQLGNNTPIIGLFGVWSQRPDGTGAEVKVSAAYGQKSTTVNRSVVATSEAGSGSSDLISQGAQVTAKYGFAVLPDVLVSPYVGVRYTQNNMGGYTEATSATVTAPLTYSALNTNATTALAGLGASYRFIPKATLFASAGVETDTNNANGSYVGTNASIGALAPINFNPNPVRTRPTATLGAFYDIVKNQRIGITGIYRQESYQAISTTTVMATYTIGL